MIDLSFQFVDPVPSRLCPPVKYSLAASIDIIRGRGCIIKIETYRYGPVAKGERFKVGSKGRLANCRRKSQAKFVAVKSRAGKDNSRLVTVEVL